ncbi:hypothetical protein TNIN_412121 [Trichonephila inaurata madagascariensis]|uniref:Uncharacterized protein n=1 Tax=Trichonephila inaurata madagascariensis TaxID=2747483 RepID=A0A8X6I6L2_9ARAC|nr:hypothetical protein TNIN_412121 [Trichonephila inaurata madagascariensis]
MSSKKTFETRSSSAHSHLQTSPISNLSSIRQDTSHQQIELQSRHRTKNKTPFLLTYLIPLTDHNTASYSINKMEYLKTHHVHRIPPPLPQETNNGEGILRDSGK